jgi:phosphomannomutase
MGSLDQIFKAYDVRGVVPDQLDAELARAIGGAFARFAAPGGKGPVLVARDMRPSAHPASRSRTSATRSRTRASNAPTSRS